MKNTRSFITLAIFVCSIALSSCESTVKPEDAVPIGDVGNDLQYINGKMYAVLDNSDKILVGTPSSSTSERIFILSQGAFTKNNARIDSWNMTDSTLTTNLFTTSNQQHTSIEFPAKSAPWKIMQISATEAFVAEFLTGNMAVIDLNSNMISSTITIGAGQNSLASIGNMVYATTGSNTLVSVNKTTKAVGMQKYIGETPLQVIGDSVHNKLIVLTAGNYSPKTEGKILFVDPATFNITDSIKIDTLHYVNQLILGGDKVYILFGDAVKVLDLGSKLILPDALFTKPYYAGYFDAPKNMLYLGTAVDFQSNDVVDIFDLGSRTLKRTLNLGIAPSFFAVVR